MLTTSQAYNQMIVYKGATKLMAYDDFAVWWATSGKIKVTKMVTRLAQRHSVLWKAGNIEEAGNTWWKKRGDIDKARWRYTVKSGDIRTARTNWERAKWTNRAARTTKYGLYRKSVGDDEEPDDDTLVDELGSGISGLTPIVIGFIISVAIGTFTLVDWEQDLYDTFTEQEISSALMTLFGGGGGGLGPRML